MNANTAMVLAAIVLALLWPLHQYLELRALRYVVNQQRDRIQQHHRAIIQLQGAAPQPPTSAGQPMPTVAEFRAKWDDVGIRSQPHLHPAPANASSRAETCIRPPDPDPTLRLRRPPALSDIESLIATAGRCLTPTELADRLERRPWDLLPELERLTTAGRIKLVPGHTAGQSAYTLADPTVRLSRMPILPGLQP